MGMARGLDCSKVDLEACLECGICWEPDDFGEDCKFCVKDQNGKRVCMYNEDCPGECSPENCPLEDDC